MNKKYLTIFVIAIVIVIAWIIIAKFPTIFDKFLVRNTNPPILATPIDPSRLPLYPYISVRKQKHWFNEAPKLLGDRPIKPLIVIAELDIKKTDVIADIGSGYGFLTFPLSQVAMLIYSIEIEPELLRYQLVLRKRMAKKYGGQGLYFDNIVFIYSHDNNLTTSENKFDIAIMCDIHILHYDYLKRGEIKKISPNQIRISKKIYSREKGFMKTVYKSMKGGAKLAVIETLNTKKIVLNKKNQILLMEKFGFSLHKDCSKSLPGCQFLIFKKL